MEKTGVHVYARGFVQGVGFRWFAIRAARKVGVAGWVKNLPDGNVELEAHGDRGPLESLLKDLRVGPAFSKVNDIEVRWIKYNPEITSFEVKY